MMRRKRKGRKRSLAECATVRLFTVGNVRAVGIKKTLQIVFYVALHGLRRIDLRKFQPVLCAVFPPELVSELLPQNHARQLILNCGVVAGSPCPGSARRPGRCPLPVPSLRRCIPKRRRRRAAREAASMRENVSYRILLPDGSIWKQHRTQPALCPDGREYRKNGTKPMADTSQKSWGVP